MECQIKSLLPIRNDDHIALYELSSLIVNAGYGVALRIECTAEGKPVVLLNTECPDSVVEEYASRMGVILQNPDQLPELRNRKAFNVGRSTARNDKSEVFAPLDGTMESFRFLSNTLAIHHAALEINLTPVSRQLRAYTNKQMNEELVSYYRTRFPQYELHVRVYADTPEQAVHAIAPLTGEGFGPLAKQTDKPNSWPHPALFAAEEVKLLLKAVTDLHCSHQDCPDMACLQTMPLPENYKQPAFMKLGHYRDQPVGFNDAASTAVVGASGSGKTVLMSEMVVGAEEKGINVLVLAPLKTDYRLLKQVITEDKLTILNVNDPCAPFFMNPFAPPEGISSGAWQPHLEEMLETAGRLDGVLPVIFRNALTRMYALYPKEKYNLETLTRSVRHILKTSAYKEKDSLLQAALSRLTALNALPCFAAHRNSFEMAELVKGGEGRVVVVELDGLPEAYMSSIGGLLVSQYFELVKRQSYSNEVRSMLMCDEAHRMVASPTITQMLVGGAHEIRAYGACLVLADQRVETLGEQLFSMACRNHVILRTACVSEGLARHLRSLPEGVDQVVENLEPGEGILQCDGMTALPFRVQADPKLLTSAEAVNAETLSPRPVLPYQHCVCPHPTGLCEEMRKIAAQAAETFPMKYPKGASEEERVRFEQGVVRKAMENQLLQQVNDPKLRQKIAQCALHRFRTEHLFRK